MACKELTCIVFAEYCASRVRIIQWVGCRVPLETVCAVLPRVSTFVQSITRCLFENQDGGIVYQLERGARFFDFDTCLRRNLIVNCHGTQDLKKALGGSTEADVQRIWLWLQQNPNEVVVFRWSNADRTYSPFLHSLPYNNDSRFCCAHVLNCFKVRCLRTTASQVETILWAKMAAIYTIARDKKSSIEPSRGAPCSGCATGRKTELPRPAYKGQKLII